MLRLGVEPDYEFALSSQSAFNQSVQEVDDEEDKLRLFTLEDVLNVLHSSVQ